MTEKMNIPKDVENVLYELRRHGIPAYPVGGCVRDFVLGRSIHDYDVTAETTPEELCDAMQSFRTVDVGLSFGTLRVLSGDTTVEVTCCRADGNYKDCRRPYSVVYNKNLYDDLARRDLTVNAMAYSQDEGIIDPFGGIGDGKKGLLRAVGEPEKRFGEDALRIMRTVRFASVLGFDIEESTSKALFACRHLLRNISAERIYTELKKLLTGDNVTDVLLGYSDIICEIIPEMAPCVGFEHRSKYHKYDVYEHIARSVGFCPPDEALRLAMLFHDIGKPTCCVQEGNGTRHYPGHAEESARIAEKVLRRLKADNKTVETVTFLIKYHDVRPAPDRKSVMRYLRETGFDGEKMLYHIRIADIKAHDDICFPDIETIKITDRIADELKNESVCLKISDLAVNGNDLIDSGVEPGKDMGKLLEMILTGVIEGQISNKKSDILQFVKENYKKVKNNC